MAGVSGDVVLDVQGVNLAFGGVQALSGIDLTIHRGDIFAIIGPNGAGKTSLLNCISGAYRPQHGKIIFNGRDVSNLTRDDCTDDR